MTTSKQYLIVIIALLGVIVAYLIIHEALLLHDRYETNLQNQQFNTHIHKCQIDTYAQGIKDGCW